MEIKRRQLLTGVGATAAIGVFAAPLSSSLQRADRSIAPLMTITSSGTYVVAADFTAASVGEPAVLVKPDVHNVNIILYSRLFCPSSLPTSRANAGIIFQGPNIGCSVIGMGGSIRGFGYGIAAQNCPGLRVRDINVDDALIRGVQIIGDDILVKNCLIRNIRGSTLAERQFCMGIEVQGASPTVLNNVIEEVYGSGPEPVNGEAVGISISDFGTNGIVMGNVVRNTRKQPKSYGYWIGGASNVSLVHNHVANMVTGVAASSPTKGMANLNTFDNCTTNFVDSGGDWTNG